MPENKDASPSSTALPSVTHGFTFEQQQIILMLKMEHEKI